MIGEVILKNKLFSGESINIEYKVEMPKKAKIYENSRQLDESALVIKAIGNC